MFVFKNLNLIKFSSMLSKSLRRDTYCVGTEDRVFKMEDPKDKGTYREIVAMDVKNYKDEPMGWKELVRGHRKGDSIVCPLCVREGKTSQIRFTYRYPYTCMSAPNGPGSADGNFDDSFYDQKGKKHVHSKQDIFRKWNCTQNHEGSSIASGYLNPCCEEMEWYMELHCDLDRPADKPRSIHE